jgi:hypothetical protein
VGLAVKLWKWPRVCLNAARKMGGAANLNNWSAGSAVRPKIEFWWNAHAQLQVVAKKILQMVRVRAGIGSGLIRF